jgi:hypothetical protein
MLITFAVLGGSSITKRFTRISGEMFEAILALLFIQQAIKVRLKHKLANC